MTIARSHGDVHSVCILSAKFCGLQFINILLSLKCEKPALSDNEGQSAYAIFGEKVIVRSY